MPCKKILVLADQHCGSLQGLTPPSFQFKGCPFQPMQVEIWSWYVNSVKGKEWDICVLNGDLIDGSGVKNGAESITTDMGQQADMFAETLSFIKAKEFIVVGGTPIHTITRDGVDVEEMISRRIGAKFYDHLFLDVNGVVFDFKHHASQSNVPLRTTAGLRNDLLWNLIHADVGNQPRADIMCRSHVHHYKYLGDSDRLAMTLPCLQAAGSRYGRRFSSLLTMGYVNFEISSEGGYKWQLNSIRPEVAKTHLLKV